MSDARCAPRDLEGGMGFPKSPGEFSISPPVIPGGLQGVPLPWGDAHLPTHPDTRLCTLSYIATAKSACKTIRNQV